MLDRGAHVAIVGGPEERALFSTLVERVRDPKCVYNLAGQLPLSELPGLLTRCALCVGNDSGSKHIAAGLGVPTIGMYSGAVDPHRYRPSGVDALSIMKNTLFSPCHLGRSDDSPRQMACLTGLSVSAVFDLSCKLLAISYPGRK